MKKKILTVASLILIVAVAFAIFINNKPLINEEKNITISVFNKESEEIYNEELKTENTYLIDVLDENEELKVVSEEGAYGAYITSIMEIEQGDNFYWSYYIDNEYANTGVSSCEVEDGKTYTFKIEKFEY